jgi:transcriptional regulator with XRE-family HTH domain
MPRPNRPRTIGSEATLAERIAFEREARGMTYEGLAVAMTEAGCSVDKSAIYRIEKGTPRRKVSVDEVVALTEVLGLSFEDLLTPIELVRQERAQELALDLREAKEEQERATRRLLDVLLEYIRLGRTSPELMEYINNHHSAAGPAVLPRLFSDERYDHLDQGHLEKVERALSDVFNRLVKVADIAAKKEA